MLDDKQFLEGTGSDVITYQPTLSKEVLDGLQKGQRLSVTAALYYQAIPPRYLQDRFTTAQGDNTRRLHYLTSHLNVKGTNIENWKLLTGSATTSVAQ